MLNVVAPEVCLLKNITFWMLCSNIVGRLKWLNNVHYYHRNLWQVRVNQRIRFPPNIFCFPLPSPPAGSTRKAEHYGKRIRWFTRTLWTLVFSRLPHIASKAHRFERIYLDTTWGLPALEISWKLIDSTRTSQLASSYSFHLNGKAQCYKN
jgi:hypothetical protein